MCDRVPDAVAGGGEGDEHHAGHEPHRHRHRRHGAVHVGRRNRAEAGYHMGVGYGDGREDEQRHEGVHEVDGLETVAGGEAGRQRRVAVDDEEAARGGEAVADMAGRGVVEAVGEGEEEGGEGAGEEEGGGHGAVGRGRAAAAVGEHGGEDVEGEGGAGGEEVGQVGRVLVHLLHGRQRRIV